MGRRYRCASGASGLTTQVDVFELTCAANKVLCIHSIKLTQSSDAGEAESEMLSVAIGRLTGASGSGGTLIQTPAPCDEGDSAFAGTCEYWNTTIGGGTPIVVGGGNFHAQAGFLHLPPPEDRIWVSGGEAVFMRLEAPTDALDLDLEMVIEEFG